MLMFDSPETAPVNDPNTPTAMAYRGTIRLSLTSICSIFLSVNPKARQVEICSLRERRSFRMTMMKLMIPSSKPSPPKVRKIFR